MRCAILRGNYLFQITCFFQNGEQTCRNVFRAPDAAIGQAKSAAQGLGRNVHRRMRGSFHVRGRALAPITRKALHVACVIFRYQPSLAVDHLIVMVLAGLDRKSVV